MYENCIQVHFVGLIIAARSIGYWLVNWAPAYMATDSNHTRVC